MQQHSWNGGELSNGQKRATELHNLALSLMPEAHLDTAPGYTHFKDQEVFLKQQFQTSSSEKILSEMVQDVFWGLGGKVLRR